MSIASELTKLQSRRDSIVTAINDKGGTCASGATLADCATAIANIPTSGGSSWTGNADEEGLKAIGWTDEDVAYLKEHIWWNEEDDDLWKVPTLAKTNYANATKTTVGGVEMATSAYFTTFKNGNQYHKFFPKVDTSALTSFSLMSIMTIYAIPLLSVDSATTLANFVQDCNNIRLIRTDKWNTSNITNFGASFCNCWHLLDLDVSNWDVSNTTNISNMFYNLRHIEKLDLSNWVTSQVTNITNFILNCFSVKEFYVGDKFCFNGITNAGLIPNPSSWDGCSMNFGVVKAWLTAYANTTSSLTLTCTFPSGTYVTDDSDGTLATLRDACVAKGWTISNLTINAYGS